MKLLLNRWSRPGPWVTSLFIAALVGTLIVLPTNSNAERGKDHGRRDAKVLLLFNSMFGVDGAFVGSTAVRGVEGDELPWVIDRVQGFLTTSGRLHIVVRGLVFPNEDGVPEELRGINDETEFRAIVSVLTDDGAGNIVTRNIITEGFPATRSGDAEINAKIELPEYAVAPIVFIIGGDEEHWFAVTGANTEGEEGEEEK